MIGLLGVGDEASDYAIIIILFARISSTNSPRIRPVREAWTRLQRQNIADWTPRDLLEGWGMYWMAGEEDRRPWLLPSVDRSN